MHADPGMQIAPMVDVVFVLLLFFMVCATLQQKTRELAAFLPGPKPFEETAAVPVEIKIDAGEAVYFNGVPMAGAQDRQMPGLREKLVQIEGLFGRNQPVVLVPDGKTRHQRIVDVISACHAAKLNRVTFSN
ncbi:MAG: biopolymer transporter ExbD [Verrucomicrobiae bacterium]|nr:biopolymer transporter ExbD [Verrucomicrobiae bacterium]